MNVTSLFTLVYLSIFRMTWQVCLKNHSHSFMIFSDCFVINSRLCSLERLLLFTVRFTHKISLAHFFCTLLMLLYWAIFSQSASQFIPACFSLQKFPKITFLNENTSSESFIISPEFSDLFTIIFRNPKIQLQVSYTPKLRRKLILVVDVFLNFSAIFSTFFEFLETIFFKFWSSVSK